MMSKQNAPILHERMRRPTSDETFVRDEVLQAIT